VVRNDSGIGETTRINCVSSIHYRASIDPTDLVLREPLKPAQWKSPRAAWTRERVKNTVKQ
jgi:hypothetical protein